MSDRGEPAAARPSIVDVAERAGVSAATVSRSLRGLAHVSAQTRQRVLDAAEELSYTVSPHASGLASGRTGSVAVVVPFISRWYFATVVRGAVDALRRDGYDAILHHLGSAADRDHFFERMPLARRVDGILTLSMPLTESHTLALRALGLPLVSVGSHVPGSASVRIDEVEAARTAVTHLVNQGHERIAMISGHPDDPRFAFASSVDRRRGYEQALEEAGLRVEPRLVVSGRHGVEGGEEAATRLLSGRPMPSAVFAEYDELALGALWALRRAGLSAPGHLSVVGIDDHEMAAVLDLTTVAQDVAEQGAVAAGLIVEQLTAGAGGSEPPDVVLPTRLVLRGSTGPPAPPARRMPRGAR